MAIQSEDYGQVCVMSPSGDFVGLEIVAALNGVEERIEKLQIVDFVIDFERVGFVDSEGLEALLTIKRRCEELFGQLKLANLDESCQKILEMTRLNHRFECHSDLASALKTMR